MFDIPWLDLVILILASFRLTHLIVYDEITSFLRKPFVRVSYEPDQSGRVVKQIDIMGKGWRYQMGLFLSCHWCVGIWASLLILAMYFWIPSSFFFILLLAIAGAAAVIESKLYAE